MKKLLTITSLLLLCGIAFAQEYKSRLPTPDETRRTAGITRYSQDVYLRQTTPRFVLNSLEYHATNYYDGIVFVKSNATVLVHVGFPNPTNNTGRRYEVSTLGACTAVLTNHTVVGSFTDMFTLTNTTHYFIESNKTAVATSTGTNWHVRLY